jgi:hypothetical protein
MEEHGTLTQRRDEVGGQAAFALGALGPGAGRRGVDGSSEMNLTTPARRPHR